ncbi:MAG: hypothetical protein ACLPUG_06245 [Acidimicrobiales bacterium]
MLLPCRDEPKDLLVIAPTTPDRIRELTSAFASTVGGRAELLACLSIADGWPDDQVLEGTDGEPFEYGTAMMGPDPLGTRLNRLATWFAREGEHRHEFIGFLGEGTLPRVQDWDLAVCEQLDALAPFGVVHPEWVCLDECPIPLFVTSETIRLLGYMVPIPLRRFCITDAMLVLSNEVDRSGCVPWLFEHRHADTFEPGTVRQYAADRNAFDRWKDSEHDRDFVKLGVRSGTYRRVRLDPSKIKA